VRAMESQLEHIASGKVRAQLHQRRIRGGSRPDHGDLFQGQSSEKVDIEWVRQGGGFIKLKHAPAGRFNLGEKLVYWLSVVAGVAVSVSGFLLLFPFYGTDIAQMQLAQVVHTLVAILFVALILAHIYIGTLGMEGAFEAMGTGEVDLNWAKEHHDIWLAEQLKKERGPGQPSVTPAE
jgi:formate dehydrogenase subunit gamma